jgi:hypothetical protein
MLPSESPGERARVNAQLEVLLGPDLIDAPRESVRTGYELVRKCTENDVAAMSGFLAWGLPLRHLRDQLCPAGWQVDRTGNFETVRSPEGKIAITSVRGDEKTGTEDMPSTATDKGPRTKKAVAINRAQLSFDPKVIGEASKVALLHKDLVTWFLLHHYDEDAQEIRLELAIPVEFVATSAASTDLGERVIATHFESRLPLESILLESAEIEDNQEQGEAEEEIDVPVSRRKTT